VLKQLILLALGAIPLAATAVSNECRQLWPENQSQTDSVRLSLPSKERAGELQWEMARVVNGMGWTCELPPDATFRWHANSDGWLIEVVDTVTDTTCQLQLRQRGRYAYLNAKEHCGFCGNHASLDPLRIDLNGKRCRYMANVAP
jgi:hypothetical protein